MKNDPHGGTATAPRHAGGPAVNGEAGPGQGFTGKYQFHPLVEAFPRLTSEQIDELADEIRMRGAAAPILKRGQIILDDYSRTIACERAGITLTFREWDGSGSLAEVIARAILPKTHLTESQRAAIAVPISDHLAGETIPAGIRGGSSNLTPGRGTGKNPKTAFGANDSVAAQLQRPVISESCSKPERPGGVALDAEKRLGRAAEIAAELCRVSPRYVYEARKLRDADRGLFDQVRRGEMNLSRARVAVSKLARAKSLIPAAKPVKRSQSGDGDRILVGDCLELFSEASATSMGGFNLIFADPPYNLGWTYDSDPRNDLRPKSEYLDWCERWIKQYARLLTSNGSMFVLIDSRWQHHFCRYMENAGLHWRNTIIWRDPFPTHTDARFQPSARFLFYFTRSKSHYTWNPDVVRVPSRRDEIGDARRVHDKGIVPHDVWEFPRIVGNSAERVPWPDAPPQVPAAILERCVACASNEGDRVLDPFTGNGTTWRAARKLGRKFTGIERSRKYAKQAEEWAMGQPAAV